MIDTPAIATLLETCPVDIEVAAGSCRSVEGALRLAPRWPTAVTNDEAQAVAASGHKCDLQWIVPAGAGAVLATPSQPDPVAQPVAPPVAPDAGGQAEACTADNGKPKAASKAAKASKAPKRAQG